MSDLLNECAGAPCLIVLPSYVIAFHDEDAGSFYSLDMLRLKIKVDPSNACVVNDVVCMWGAPSSYYHYTSTGIGKYRDMHVLKFDEKPNTSIAVGMSLISAKGNTAGEGFLEFNPSKLYDEGLELIRRLIGAGCRFVPVRYDLAIDYKVPRDTVRIVRDRRDYESRIGDSLTEYLGSRNAPGRVKVYDKQAESKLDAPCTRVELTCDADWSVSKVIEKLPTVFTYESLNVEGLRGITKAFAMSVRSNMMHGDTLENWLVCCEPRMRRTIRSVFAENQVFRYSASCIEQVKQEVEALSNGVSLAL